MLDLPDEGAPARDMPSITTYLRNPLRADEDPLRIVLPLLYGRLHQIAAGQMKSQDADHTLQATSLANEAVMRLLRSPRADWTDRQHVLATAARIMRQILVDHARAKGRQKRGGDATRVPLDDAVLALEDRSAELPRVDETLDRLEVMNPRGARLIEMRFFLGLSMDEASDALGTSKRTLEREWTVVRAWLCKELAPHE